MHIWKTVAVATLLTSIRHRTNLKNISTNDKFLHDSQQSTNYWTFFWNISGNLWFLFSISLFFFLIFLWIFYTKFPIFLHFFYIFYIFFIVSKYTNKLSVHSDLIYFFGVRKLLKILFWLCQKSAMIKKKKSNIYCVGKLKQSVWHKVLSNKVFIFSTL